MRFQSVQTSHGFMLRLNILPLLIISVSFLHTTEAFIASSITRKCISRRSTGGLHDSHHLVNDENSVCESVHDMKKKEEAFSQSTALGENIFNNESYDITVATKADSSRRDFFAASTAALLATSLISAPKPASASIISSEQLNNPLEFSLDEETSTLISNAATTADAVDVKAILQKASKRALGGGKAGAYAAVLQVLTLMWLRTAMNYQYRYGGDLKSSLSTLFAEGGIPRLYQGLPFALVQGPLTKFGDTAANVGILALLSSIPETADWPLPLRTACGSAVAGLWRIVCMPIDTSKTAMQVEGAKGLSKLKDQVTTKKSLSPLYQGAVASAAATAVGHYPWFLTYNFLSDVLPIVEKGEENAVLLGLVRAAALGLSASCVSDICSNSLRVIKTTKQTAGLYSSETGVDSAASARGEKNSLENEDEVTYREALNMVLEQDGWAGLFGRGLQTRLLTNAIQGATFSVLWKYFLTVGGN